MARHLLQNVSYKKLRKTLATFNLEPTDLKAGRGAHRCFRNTVTGHKICITYHSGKDIPAGTLEAFLKTSGIARHDFIRALGR